MFPFYTLLTFQGRIEREHRHEMGQEEELTTFPPSIPFWLISIFASISLPWSSVKLELIFPDSLSVCFILEGLFYWDGLLFKSFVFFLKNYTFIKFNSVLQFFMISRFSLFGSSQYSFYLHNINLSYFYEFMSYLFTLSRFFEPH